MKGALIYSDFNRAGRIEASDVDERYQLVDPVVVIDSRKVVEGAVFVALPGERTDGHRFVGAVFANGASWAVVSSEWFSQHGSEHRGEGRRFLVADDPVAAFQQLATAYRERFDIPVIGIGGSNGKTTTKEMVAAVLSTAFKVRVTQGNYNNHLGVPLTLFQLRRDTEMAVIEMGINHPGEMAFLASIARPTHGLLTNIGHEHLEFFGSLDGVAKAEAELFDYLEVSGGTAFVNLDDHRLAAAGASLSRKICYGAVPGEPCAWWAEEVGSDRVGRIAFTLCSEAGIRQPVAMNFIGRHNVTNAVAAAAVGAHFGLAPEQIASGLGELMPASGWKRMELLEAGGVVVLNDTYNANPDSVRLALDTLASLDCSGRKLAVIGDMLELGGNAALEHESIGNYIRQLPIDGCVTIGPLAGSCCQNAQERCLGHFETMDDLDAFLGDYVRPGDAVLFKGSRGMKLELAAEALVKRMTPIKEVSD
ncbi:UDP-N-acetylmuramoylalanyl-D-glutamyl-2,6-diaminopimelate/D-alanyl-D-alanyl ligase [Chlorobaculum parvum NCIB 8327]|uniref:UDP-N-acetylmuramoyl-tripeptide--D-alanyl-D-alanine ligase n=1 Tax=Chlorobaculum parvum (strain DSM 263 / NCIMB 8327) TaxID=517417 RepID=B3QLW8_CHLP8|nr:UDP-N-acetylmuramoyl-tripeptide--D-alanyl-D-alanine ligase [Chlorobaculum parvum]ACF12454.1 UDP-N-acetylmuramoylalanyl-D-glutamyl-2,6-diaminopimelate/D-alanyl-D-alanyl ligase [Chlorobaculum parvum NCIB 8327]